MGKSRHNLISWYCLAAILCAAGTSIGSARADSAALAELKVYPANVNLTSAADQQSLVVEAVFDDELTRDVTAEAKIELGNPQLARVDAGIVHPSADGETEIKVEFDGKSTSVPLIVKN